MLDQRGQLLRAALGFATLPSSALHRGLHALRTYLDSWAGVGHVAVGVHRQGFDFQLTQYDERGWQATLRKLFPNRLRFSWDAKKACYTFQGDPAYGGLLAGTVRETVYQNRDVPPG